MEQKPDPANTPANPPLDARTQRLLDKILREYAMAERMGFHNYPAMRRDMDEKFVALRRSFGGAR